MARKVIFYCTEKTKYFILLLFEILHLYFLVKVLKTEAASHKVTLHSIFL